MSDTYKSWNDMNGIDCIMFFEFPAQPSLAAVAYGDMG